MREPTSDQEQFRQLYPRLLRFAAVVAPMEDDPNDLVQEAVARTLRRHTLADLQSPEHYLRTAILRLASNRRRTLSVRRRAAVRFTPPSAAVDDHPSDLADLVRLPPSVRAVLFLVEVEGWSYREVSALLGFPSRQPELERPGGDANCGPHWLRRRPHERRPSYDARSPGRAGAPTGS